MAATINVMARYNRFAPWAGKNLVLRSDYSNHRGTRNHYQSGRVASSSRQANPFLGCHLCLLHTIKPFGRLCYLLAGTTSRRLPARSIAEPSLPSCSARGLILLRRKLANQLRHALLGAHLLLPSVYSQALIRRYPFSYCANIRCRLRLLKLAAEPQILSCEQLGSRKREVSTDETEPEFITSPGKRRGLDRLPFGGDKVTSINGHARRLQFQSSCLPTRKACRRRARVLWQLLFIAGRLAMRIRRHW
jgi:hypothetical protein